MLPQLCRRVPRWVWPITVLLLAASLRLIALGRPGMLVFDELYYVRDAVSQLAHGFPTTWPDDDSAFGGERARSFTDEPSLAVHPPLGKWLIGLGMLALGVGEASSGGPGLDTGWGWRIAVAIVGVLTVALVMRIAHLLTGSLHIATLAGLFLAIDGVHVVLSRVALLDGFLTMFVTAGALLMVRDHLAVGESWRAVARQAFRQDPDSAGPHGRYGPILWRRPWLIAASFTFGLAAGVKWSGLFALAAFLLLTVARDLIVRARLRSAGILPRRIFPGVALQTLATGLIALPVALIAYIATWLGWILTDGGWGRQAGAGWPSALWKFHVETISWHGSLSAPHPYRSDPWTWPLGLHPTAMYFENLPGGLVSVITPIPNPIVTWAGALALVALAALMTRAFVRALRRAPVQSSIHEDPRVRSPWRAHWQTVTASPLLAAAAFALVGYLSGWLPWIFAISRSAVFQFYAVVLTPFSALALALALAAFVAPRPGRTPEDLVGRKVAACIVVCASLAAAAFFLPLWTAMPIEQWYWQLHLWLPGWR